MNSNFTPLEQSLKNIYKIREIRIMIPKKDILLASSIKSNTIEIDVLYDS